MSDIFWYRLTAQLKEYLKFSVENSNAELIVRSIANLKKSHRNFRINNESFSECWTLFQHYYQQSKHLTCAEFLADLVTATAHNMGIELRLSEVESIASNLDYSADSLEEGIEDIESAITAFVEYKAQVNQEKINRMITQVRSTVSQRNEETSQRLNNGLNQIARDIQQGNTDFKSSIRSALKCFAVPTEKTG